MKTQYKGLSVVAAVLFAAGHASAAGFALYETSARGIAMGGATMGLYNDASAVYANPALITDSGPQETLFGLSLINPSMEIELQTPYGTSSYSPEDKWFPPPFAYYTRQLDDSLWLGLGLFTPFGLGVEHDSDWPGRFSSVDVEITTFNVTPELAWKISDSVSVALGLDVMYFDITLRRNIPAVDRMLDIQADSLGYGGTAALSWKATDTLGLGLVYRSEVRQEIENHDTHIRGIPGNYKCWETLTLPQSASIGLNYSGVEKWNFGAIATWTDWRSYEDITLHFKPALLGAATKAKSDKCWNDVWRLGAGAEYKFSDQSFIEFGYVYDEDPIPSAHADYMLPAGDRHIISVGLRTMISDNWEMGIAFAKTLLRDKTIHARPEEGIYETKFKDGDSNIYSIQLSRKF